MSKDQGDKQRVPATIPRSAGLLLVISVIVMLAGGALWGWSAIQGGDDPAPRSDVASPAGEAPLGFGEILETDGGSVQQAADPSGLDLYSPAVFRLGFSFFAGFCVAYLIRSFLKIVFLVSGVVILAMFGLQSAGVADIDWHGISGHFSEITDALRNQTDTFKTFITGYLPSTGMSVFGMFMGFRRRS